MKIVFRRLSKACLSVICVGLTISTSFCCESRMSLLFHRLMKYGSKMIKKSVFKYEAKSLHLFIGLVYFYRKPQRDTTFHLFWLQHKSNMFQEHCSYSYTTFSVLMCLHDRKSKPSIKQYQKGTSLMASTEQT